METWWWCRSFCFGGVIKWDPIRPNLGGIKRDANVWQTFRFWKTRGTTIASDLFALLVVGLDVAVLWLNEKKHSCLDKSAVGISVIFLFVRYDWDMYSSLNTTISTNISFLYHIDEHTVHNNTWYIYLDIIIHNRYIICIYYSMHIYS